MTARTPGAGAGDKLDRYRAKRDFAKTKEPQGAALAPGRRLIVQRHFATREHFDLRLEIDSVLVSWAVTRGPSADPRDKRLAVRTEDHPLDYARFEGTIPKGEYGGGAVLLWESTTYDPLNGDPAQALAKGEIKFRSHGARLRGDWVVVRMKTKDKSENWLLIKERDAFAETDDSLARRYDDSVVSGRDRAAVERGDPVAPRPRKAAKTPLPRPDFILSMLCDSSAAPPDGAGWLAEMKYDGYRLQLAVGEGEARAYTRAGLDWTAKFPAIVAAARGLPCRAALIDGEAVRFDAKGLSDFPALVAALESRSGDIAFVAFDLLSLDGEDRRAAPLTERKAALRALLKGAPAPLRFAEHVEGDVAQAFADVAGAGAEGIIAKRLDAPYVSGRSSNWLKIKAARREDVVVVGYMPSTKGESFASLLAAVETPEGLRYAGRIGTGYAAAKRDTLAARLAPRATPLTLCGAVSPPRGAVFLKTPFRAEIGHGGWTSDRQLRHARFLAPRDDLPLRRDGAAMSPSRPAAVKTGALAPVTHPERVLFPADGVTKGDVAAYYASVAERIAPHLAKRPVSILRAPEGIGGETFFQRHPLKGMSAGIVEVAQGDKVYFALDGAVGLRTAAQFGAIELHGWMSRADALDRPDRMIFDLDPHESVAFDTVKAAARRIAEGLEVAGLKSWPLLTGGKGVHVVAPLDRSLDAETVEAFAKGFAEGMAADAPDRYVASMSKARRAGRIFIDWMRNKPAATAVLPWSLRARPGATVAVPVSWRGLAAATSANAATLRDAPKLRDGWAGFFEARQTIPAKALAFMRAR